MPSLKQLKRWRSHEKNQEREMARAAAQTEQAKKDLAEGRITIPGPRVTQSVYDRLESEVTETTGITKGVTRENVQAACKVMLRMPPRQRPQLVSSIHSNLPGEIYKLIQTRTAQQVYDFYWDIVEFQQIWKVLGFIPNDLKSFINVSARLAGKEQI